MPEVGIIFKMTYVPKVPRFEIDVPKVGLILKLMCPRWASFSNFKLAGHIQKRKYSNNCRGNELFFGILVVP